MGISRDSRHKRRLTGGRRNIHQKKRQYELGRPAAMTKLAPRRVAVMRTHGGNRKFRALRLDTGNFSWGSEVCTRRTRVLDVVYNATNNELLRTKTLVKNAIVQIDATPFRQYYEQHYGVVLGKKSKVSTSSSVE
jgi:small subunit ribosomal protein S8e